MDPVCERCGSADAVEWDENLYGCVRCGRQYGDIRFAYEGKSLDDRLEVIGEDFQFDLSVAWWRAGK